MQDGIISHLLVSTPLTCNHTSEFRTVDSILFLRSLSQEACPCAIEFERKTGGRKLYRSIYSAMPVRWGDRHDLGTLLQGYW